MKRLFFLLLAASTVVLSANAGKKHKWTVVDKPIAAYSFQEALVPTSVSVCDTCTRITFDVDAIYTWNLAPTTRLIAGGQVLPVRRGRALQVAPPSAPEQPIDTTRHEVPFVFGTDYYGMQAIYNGEVNGDLTPSIVLEFPPLPKGTKSFDFDEGTGNPYQFCITGIRLDGQPYPAPLAGKQDAAEPFRWTASASSDAKEARVRVKIIGENLPDNLDIQPRLFPVYRDNPLMESLTEPRWIPADDGSKGGTVVTTFALPTPYVLYIGNCRLDCYFTVFVPGEETLLTIDYTALHAAAMTPDQKGPDYHNYSYANGTDFNLLLPDGSRSSEKEMFNGDLIKRATNPDVAELRIKERTDAEALLNRCGRLEEVAESEVNAVATAYRGIVTEKWKESCDVRTKLAEGTGGKICEVPDVAPAEIIKNIVSNYKGKVVYVDLWATWCGPCCQGIKAMKPHHDDFSADDVQFVYITDESSPADKWNAMLIDMTGHHYRLKSMNGLEPAISGIPRYLIFDRDGNLSFDQSGFGPGMENRLCDEIRKAMAK